MAHRKDSTDTRQRILSTCVRLFIEKGYTNTKMTDILNTAQVSNSSFQNLFHTKDGILMDLVEFMFSAQFTTARSLAQKELSPCFVYAIETSIQMALAEINENLREIDVGVYTKAEAAEYIYRKTAAELYRIFGKYMPECSESDFYEIEIGTAGIMRNYMSTPCNVYFTLENKLKRFLSMTLTLFNVPKTEQEKVIGYIIKTDIRETAKGVMQKLFHALEMEYDFEFKSDNFI